MYGQVAPMVYTWDFQHDTQMARSHRDRALLPMASAADDRRDRGSIGIGGDGNMSYWLRIVIEDDDSDTLAGDAHEYDTLEDADAAFEELIRHHVQWTETEAGIA
jgi:hypothetical protein